MINLTKTKLTFLAAAFLVITGNHTFFTRVIESYPLNASNSGFLLSIVIALICILVLITAIPALIIPVRMVVSIYLVAGSITAYFTGQYQTIFNEDMLTNVMQTHPAEAWDIINSGLISHVALFGLLPVITLWMIPMKHVSRLRELRYSVQTIVGALVILVACGFMYGDSYASFIRLHKAYRHYTNPSYPIYSLIKYTGALLSTPGFEERQVILPDAKISSKDAEKELIILVVGETARKDRFSLYGYQRKTNPRLSKEKNLITYDQVTACGTSTAVSVPCMFSLRGREIFDASSEKYSENALDVLSRLGVSILWRDNNSSSKGVADRVTYQDYSTPKVNPVCDTECRDIGMLHGLQDYIDSQPGDILIVLHQSGSHGPAYYKRYPEEYEKFKPVCYSAELAQCTQEQLDNTFDNTILYTDYFLAQVIELLKKNTPQYETAMLYVSDHGESLGENGLYLHGMPYMFAPKEQVDVPVILWVGDSSDVDMGSALSRKGIKTSHDAVFHSLLEAFEVTESIPAGADKLYKVGERYRSSPSEYAPSEQ